MFTFPRAHPTYSVMFLANTVERKHRIRSLCNILKCYQTGGIYIVSSFLSGLQNWPNPFSNALLTSAVVQHRVEINLKKKNNKMQLSL